MTDDDSDSDLDAEDPDTDTERIPEPYHDGKESLTADKLGKLIGEAIARSQAPNIPAANRQPVSAPEGFTKAMLQKFRQLGLGRRHMTGLTAARIAITKREQARQYHKPQTAYQRDYNSAVSADINTLIRIEALRLADWHRTADPSLIEQRMTDLECRLRESQDSQEVLAKIQHDHDQGDTELAADMYQVIQDEKNGDKPSSSSESKYRSYKTAARKLKEDKKEPESEVATFLRYHRQLMAEQSNDSRSRQPYQPPAPQHNPPPFRSSYPPPPPPPQNWPSPPTWPPPIRGWMPPRPQRCMVEPTPCN